MEIQADAGCDSGVSGPALSQLTESVILDA